MHPVLLHTHNLLRWVILVLGALTLIRAAQGLSGTSPYAPTRRIGVFFMASLHTQLLLGLGLFVISPTVDAAMADVQATMADRALRFFLVEHPTMMVAAVIVATVGSLLAKNALDDRARHRRLLIFTAITMLLLVAGIPWQRPFLPGM